MTDSALPREPDGRPARLETVVLDLDGTLVDSVYVHVLAWQAAFRDVGLGVPAHHLHALIGMGGDRLVTAAAGQAAEDALGDELRTRHIQHLDELFDRIGPTEGATELLETLRSHQFEIVLASSSDASLTHRLLELVPGGEGLLGSIVTGSDAERSKPSGELVEVALRSVEAGRSIVVGDAVWDARAARDAHVSSIGLLTGGFSEAALVAAGALACFATPAALAAHVERTGTLLPDTGV